MHDPEDLRIIGRMLGLIEDREYVQEIRDYLTNARQETQGPRPCDGVLTGVVSKRVDAAKSAGRVIVIQRMPERVSPGGVVIPPGDVERNFCSATCMVATYLSQQQLGIYPLAEAFGAVKN